MEPPTKKSITRSDMDRLMIYHDRQFVELAYRLILQRPEDETGLAHYLDLLRNGVSRKEVAFQIASSQEARERGVGVGIFGGYVVWRKIEQIPIFGTLCLLALCLVRFKHVTREFRRLQNAAFGRGQGL